MFKRRMIHAHIRASRAYGATSYARRLQVGAVIVDQTTDQPVSIGWNGTAPGQPNICEFEDDNGNLVSHEGVIHAEINAMRKLRSRHNKELLSLFVSHSPCPDCAKEIVRSGIKQVFFYERYRLNEGMLILLDAGIELFHVTDSDVFDVAIATKSNTTQERQLITSPSKFDKSDVLLTNRRRRMQSGEFKGIKNFNNPWYTAEIRLMEEMFDDGATAQQISTELDRSMGSIVEKLKISNRLSFLNGVGAMKTVDGVREVWCSVKDTRENRMAVESEFERFVPVVHEYMDKVSAKLEDVIEQFKSDLSTTLIRIAYHRK